MTFVEALYNQNLEAIRSFPKADLHNHFVLGGSREYIFNKTGYQIESITTPLKSMSEMDAWSRKYIGNRFNSPEGRKLLIEATFEQAKSDGVTVLEIGEDVWGLGEFFDNDIEKLIFSFQEANERIAPEIELRLQIGLSRHCPVDYLMDCLSHFWGHKEFYSIDLYGDELAQPIENFIPIYEKAAENGLVLKAHVGEWGTAKDIVTSIELLHLNEVQHGIAAVQDEDVMDYLIENNIRLNVTPSSNVLLGRVPDMSHHPIAKLYRKGVDVTIGSDDVLIFDSDVSKEYLRLYQSGCLTKEELDAIRVNGLKDRKDTKRNEVLDVTVSNGEYNESDT
ncbi:MAG: adenosine deaminase [Lachnospiraceae bacterium]|nr:adenosine deaminase [Lachnospiraceae bacterium]